MIFRRKRETAKKSCCSFLHFPNYFSLLPYIKGISLFLCPFRPPENSRSSGAPGLPRMSSPPTCGRPVLLSFFPCRIEKKLFSVSISSSFVYTFYFLKNLFFFYHLFSCTTLPNYAIVIAVRKHLYPILSLWVFPLPNPYRPERCFLTAFRFLPKKHGESHAFFLSGFPPAVYDLFIVMYLAMQNTL